MPRLLWPRLLWPRLLWPCLLSRRAAPFASLARALLTRLALILAVLAGAPLAGACAAHAQIAAPDQAATLADLVKAARIPFERFVLDNGLVTIVHTDRKAPIVGVTVYYRVGSKHEPRGRTGFAHLFEHLMFGGSENVENFDMPLEAAGSTAPNGSTYYDRTNYVLSVPTGALDLALFMESDRMGHLLGAVTQEKLDNQRAVVQNEKRQGDNQPYGLLRYLRSEGLLPIGHPYRHHTIGSMADLDAASLEDVHAWFLNNYGPNNVVLVLTGDIDTATARPMVERWFGGIARGPDVAGVAAGPVTLPAPIERVETDQVPLPSLFRFWTGPGLDHPDALALEMGMAILGGLQSSRLDDALVRGAGLAVAVSASAEAFEQLSFLEAQVDVKDAAHLDAARAALDAQIQRLIAEGPSEAELGRARIQVLAAAIANLEQVGGFGGKGAILAEGELYARDPGFEHRRLERLAMLEAGDVRQALARWLTRPAYTLTLMPGARTLDGAMMGGWGDEGLDAPAPGRLAPAPAPAASADAAAAPAPIAAPITAPITAPARIAPEVARVGALDFPQIERARLANGIEVVLARRAHVPQVSLALSIAAGSAVDGPLASGRQQMMIDLLTEGTTSKDALAIAIAQEELGSTLFASSGIDGDTIHLRTLAINLAPSLGLLVDVVRNPAFGEGEVERVRAQRLAAIAQQRASPGGIASRAFMPLIYGGDHPYARAGSAGDEAAVRALRRADLALAHSTWFRPELMTITAVGDVTMAQLLAALEPALGNWQAPGAPALASAPGPGPARLRDQRAPPPVARLLAIDRPNSPSSYLLIGRTLPMNGHPQGIEPVLLANDVLGGGFLSRLMGDLRETKGWTYGIGSAIPAAAGQRRWEISAQVQADRTADSIRAIIAQIDALPDARPIEAAEFQRVTDGAIRGLPNGLETNGQLLGALLGNQRLGRDLAYQARLPEIYRALDQASIEQAARQWLRPRDLTILVVGDRRAIAAQLDQLGAQTGTGVEWLVPAAP